MYYSEDEARRLVIEAGLRLQQQKLVARTWGNISARISDGQFVITPSGKAYDSLTEADLVTVNIEDGSYEGDIKPSSEKGVHADAYAFRSDAAFVVHTHQYFASVVAAECRDTDFAPCAEYGLPGTSRLKRYVKKCIEANPDCRMFLMARHGALLIGKDMEDAFDLSTELEERCRKLMEQRVPSHDSAETEAFDASAVRIDALPHIKVVSDPYIMECCRAGMRVLPYIDDFAQIVGPDMQVVDNDAWTVERTLLGYSTNNIARGLSGRIPLTGALEQMGGRQPALNLVIGRNAVLVRGVGAVCAGMTADDADAVASIVSKNCAAACYVRNAKPIGDFDARLQRYIYLTKYSRQMEE